MHSLKQTLVLAATLLAALVAAPALYASDSRDAPGAVHRHGMMEGGSMMGRSGQMMDGCGAMMQGGHGDRPNDQWRKNAPRRPGSNG